MFGDKKSVVDRSTVPHAKLHKCYNAFSFHQVRKTIATGIIGFFHIVGVETLLISLVSTGVIVISRSCCSPYFSGRVTSRILMSLHFIGHHRILQIAEVARFPTKGE